MENQERIIEKIKKVLELSRKNPSEEEAKAAALKAQQLMAEYHITMREIDDIDDVEKIVERHVSVKAGKKWKYQLASIVAKNFRCRYFMYGSKIIVFYGYETDATIAAETFTYLFTVGNKAAKRYIGTLYKEAHDNGEFWDGSGVINNFLIGYMGGIKEVLDKQCTALMIVTPKEVHEAYDARMSGVKRSVSNRLDTRTQYQYRERARTAGRQTGRDAVISKRLEAVAV